MSNDYGKQVADLTETAFQHAREASGVEYAGLQLQAAQAIATLGLATEVRAVGLLLAAGRAVTPSAEVAGEAYMAAAIMLGLVAEDDVPAGGDPTPADNDPADAEVEL